MAERPLFDPSRIRVPASERSAAPTGPTTVTVWQVNELVRGAIARHLPPTLHVLGEIGDFSHAGSGHLYFTLKDEQSELRAVMWRSTAGQLKFAPEVGMQVIATGGIEVYTPRGTYQLIVRKLEPRGIGALELAFRQLKEKLEREGLFDPRRKKPLPRIPSRVAVVTSPAGAAIRDILQTLARRFPALDVLVFPVRVQGEGAAEEIAAAIGLLNRQAEALGGIDVAIVGRGGGSLEDLWAFNTETVARAIAASRIPIVSAVGHEIDVSISDLVADVRAATPTAAAELITPKMSDLIEWLARSLARVERTTTHAAELARARLDNLLARDPLARPLGRLRERGQLLDDRQQRLRLLTVQLFRHTRERLNRAELAVLRLGTGAQFARASHKLGQRFSRLQHAWNRLALSRERDLNQRLARLEHASPLARIERCDERCHQTQRRLRLALTHGLALAGRRLQTRLDALAACDPKNVLRRGYSITRDARTRRIIRSIQEVRDRLRIATQLADGEFRATADDPRQPGLFDE